MLSRSVGMRQQTAASPYRSACLRYRENMLPAAGHGPPPNAKMQMFTAYQRFGPWNGESWNNYIEWSGFHHIRELVSTDQMLCPAILDKLNDTDWQYNIHADNKVYFFHDIEYLKRRIIFDPSRHNILSITERPNSPIVADVDFEFCGYDILDSDDSISVLTNCGAFPGVFEPSEVNKYGLLDDLSRSLEIAAHIRKAKPEDPHCGDCRVWALCRYVGAGNRETSN